MFVSKLKLGDILINDSIINHDQLEVALSYGKECSLKVGQALVELNYCSEEAILKAYAKQFQVEFISLEGIEIDPKLMAKVPVSLLQKINAIPLKESEDHILAVFSDPLDIDAQDALQRIFPNKPLRIALSFPEQINRQVSQFALMENIKELMIEIRREINSGLIDETGTVSGIMRLIETIVTHAMSTRGSDIHIEPGEKNCRVRIRIDGLLHEAFLFDNDIYAPLATRMKLLSDIDIAERRRPQDGRFSLPIDAKSIDFRVSTLPTIYGESIVLRILDKSKALIKLSDAGMSPSSLNKFTQALAAPYGIIFVTGPTGSGKTTTLYGALNAVKSVEKKIITVEDPVEYQMPLIQQVQVNEKAGLTFASTLRSILRQDPDIIMVGEVRDQETLRIAVQAALTGHLVFSTLHTNDAISAISRILDMGIEGYLMSGALVAIEAQRLIRKICPYCKKEAIVPPQVLEQISSYTQGTPIFYKGVGCEKCNNSGYLGRDMVSEVLTISSNIAALIAHEATKKEITEVALAEGFITMFADGVTKASQGITSLEEILRVTKLSI